MVAVIIVFYLFCGLLHTLMFQRWRYMLIWPFELLMTLWWHIVRELPKRW